MKKIRDLKDIFKDKGQCTMYKVQSNEWEQSFKILQIPDINKSLIKNRNEKSI